MKKTISKTKNLNEINPNYKIKKIILATNKVYSNKLKLKLLILENSDKPLLKNNFFIFSFDSKKTWLNNYVEVINITKQDLNEKIYTLFVHGLESNSIYK